MDLLSFSAPSRFGGEWRNSQIFGKNSSIEQVATQIIAGEPFKSETLAELHPSLDSIKASAYCRPAALRSTAIIELRMQEVAASKSDREQIDQQLKSTESVIRKSLSCAPADSFLWLALYSVEVTKTGFKPDYLKYLRLSYQLGPQEGWIALKRDPLAFAQFQNLPVDLRGDAVSEFVAMVADHFYRSGSANSDRPGLAGTRANSFTSGTA